MVQTFVKHLVKTDRVDKQASVDPVNIRNLNIDAMQKESVDLIALQRLFLSWLQDDTWYVEMLSVSQSLIDPCLYYSRI